MKRTVIVTAVLVSLSGIACSPSVQNTPMESPDFFATPPKAERAFLSGYGSDALDGQFGIRIETEPLSFVDPDLDRELEPDILLEYLSLPSIDPAELENTRFSPDSGYEGSFCFLGEHNWVDLKEIRFLNASGDSILAEYDLVIHLPRTPPNEYPITLRVQTEIKAGDPQLEAPRFFDGLGTLVQDEEDVWKGSATYDGHPVEIQLCTDAASIEEIGTYARSVITGQSLPRSRMNEEITEGLRFLADKFTRFNVSADFRADEFIPRRFSFFKRRHHESPDVVIVLHHPSDVGHWSLSFARIEKGGSLIWVPKR